MPPVPKPVVVDDKTYLAFLRACPCVMQVLGLPDCNERDTIGSGPSEASHLDTKSRDDRAISMCGGHHRTNPVSWHHGKESFCRHYEITEEELVALAEAQYLQWVALEGGVD